MKKLSILGLMLVLAPTLSLSACVAGYYVSDQPVEPVYVHTAPPYEGAIWIGSEWTWNGGRYVHVPGHWERPRPGRAYVGGFWEHSNHGYRWHRGHWR